MTGCVESTKIRMGWNGSAVALIPVFMSSIIGMISAIMKFEQFPEKMETLVQAISLLTNTLLKARNHTELDDELLHEYHSSLQANESSLYPDIRKTYLKEAHKNLLCIMKAEQIYYDNIQKVNAGEKIKIKCENDSDTTSSSTDNIIINTASLEVDDREKLDSSEEKDEMDTSNRPETKRQLPQIKEGFENL